MMARFDYTLSAGVFTRASPRLPMELSLGNHTVAVEGLVDTGSSINVLPYDYGLALGMRWEEYRIPLTLTGVLADYEARAAFVWASNARLTGRDPVRLSIAWTTANDVPVILGQTNFMMEFNVCFYLSQNYFEVWRN